MATAAAQVAPALQNSNDGADNNDWLTAIVISAATIDRGLSRKFFPVPRPSESRELIDPIYGSGERRSPHPIDENNRRAACCPAVVTFAYCEDA